MKDFDTLNNWLNHLKEDFSKIEEMEEDLLKQEPKIKRLLEQYQEVEIVEEEVNEWWKKIITSFIFKVQTII